jgi:hypothetical protein
MVEAFELSLQVQLSLGAFYVFCWIQVFVLCSKSYSRFRSRKVLQSIFIIYCTLSRVNKVRGC